MTVTHRFNVIRFPDERRVHWQASNEKRGPASVVIFPVITRGHPDWHEAQVARLDGIALLFKLKHPSVAIAFRDVPA